MISAQYEEATGIVVSMAIGLASIEEFDAYVRDLMVMMTRSRKRHGRSLHFVDAADCPVQSREAFDHMATLTANDSDAEDRCAILVSSAFAKLQMARLPDTLSMQFFAKASDARSWLLTQSKSAI